MKTLVIHPKDETTDFLSDIYSDKNWTVINTNVSKKILKEQIKSHDRIVMLGHGSENGLFGFDRMVIDSNLVYLLREKNCICIWCNADMFVNKYKLSGFYTGMIISEEAEAIYYSILSNKQLIDESNIKFAKAIKESIDTDDMLLNVKELYQSETKVIKFNQNNLYEN